MAYNPINIEAFTAAFAGAIAGMSTGGWIVNPSPTSYSALTNIAGAYAQAFDTAWNSAAPLNSLEQAAITDAIASEFSGRTPTLSNLALQQASNWTVNANACVAAVLQSDAYFAANGLIPPVVPISPVGPSPYSSVTDWWVSPATGNDTNSGTSSNSPLKTKAEIARRLGSWNPTINGINVTVHQLDPDTTANDPWLFLPTLIGGANMLLTAPLPTPSFTGTLLAVTAKNRGAGTPLQSTFTTVTGAVTKGMLLVNTTRGNSRAWAYRNNAGTWLITQPLQPQVAGSFGQITTEVDTWANGDAIIGYNPIAVNVGAVGSNTFGPTVNGNGMAFNTITFADLTGTNANPSSVAVEGIGSWYISECFVTPALSGAFTSNQARSIQPLSKLANCWIAAGGSLGSAGIEGGGNDPTPASGSELQLWNGYVANDFYSGVNYFSNINYTLGGMYLDGANGFLISGGNSSIGGTGTAIYGPNTANMTMAAGGVMNYTSTASSRFPGITLAFGGSSNGYSYLTTAGTTAIHQLTLTVAHLDAAAGATGFGGTAYSQIGALITNGNAN